MNAKLFLLCFFSATAAFAADPSTQFNSTALPPIPLNDPWRWRGLLTEKHDSPTIALGKTDFSVNGPLVEGFRRLPHVDDLSRGQRFLRLPIIRLFVPGPMESPPGTGKYFSWRNEDNHSAWALTASRPGIGKGPY